VAAHEEARPLLEQAGDTAGLAECVHGLGDALMFLGSYQESIHSYREAIRLCQSTGNRSLAAESRFMVGFTHLKLGKLHDAEHETERSLGMLGEIGDVWNTSPALMAGGQIAMMRGNFGRALDYLTRGLHLGRQLNATRFIVFHLYALGLLHRELENASAAEQHDREAADHAVLIGGAWLPVVRAALAVDAARLGSHDAASAELAGAWQALTESHRPADFAQEVTLAEGLVMLEFGRPLDAARAADGLIQIASETGTEARWHSAAHAVKGHALLALGDPAAALNLFEDAAAEAATIDSPPLYWRALAGAALAQQALDRRDDAQQTARRAREVIEGLAAGLPDERLRATFLQSARVLRITAVAGGG